MINCQNCNYLIPLNKYVGREFINCPSCKKDLQIFIFPELLRPLVKGSSGENAIEGLDATCFAHAEKKARTICNQCGSYICELCEIPKNDKIICSKCFNNEDKLDIKSPFEKTYRQYSVIVSTLLVFCFLLWFLSLLLAPIAMYISLKYQNAEEGFLCGSRKGRKRVYAIISGAIIAIWAVIFILIAVKG